LIVLADLARLAAFLVGVGAEGGGAAIGREHLATYLAVFAVAVGRAALLTIRRATERERSRQAAAFDFGGAAHLPLGTAHPVGAQIGADTADAQEAVAVGIGGASIARFAGRTVFHTVSHEGRVGVVFDDGAHLATGAGQGWTAVARWRVDAHVDAAIQCRVEADVAGHIGTIEADIGADTGRRVIVAGRQNHHQTESPTHCLRAAHREPPCWRSR
jgi:hypothetical protein